MGDKGLQGTEEGQERGVRFSGWASASEGLQRGGRAARLHHLGLVPARPEPRLQRPDQAGVAAAGAGDQSPRPSAGPRAGPQLSGRAPMAGQPVRREGLGYGPAPKGVCVWGGDPRSLPSRPPPPTACSQPPAALPRARPRSPGHAAEPRGTRGDVAAGHWRRGLVSCCPIPLLPSPRPRPCCMWGDSALLLAEHLGSKFPPGNARRWPVPGA